MRGQRGNAGGGGGANEGGSGGPNAGVAGGAVGTYASGPRGSIQENPHIHQASASPLSKADRMRHRMTSAITTWGTADHVYKAGQRRLSQVCFTPYQAAPNVSLSSTNFNKHSPASPKQNGGTDNASVPLIRSTTSTRVKQNAGNNSAVMSGSKRTSSPTPPTRHRNSSGGSGGGSGSGLIPKVGGRDRSETAHDGLQMYSETASRRLVEPGSSHRPRSRSKGNVEQPAPLPPPAKPRMTLEIDPSLFHETDDNTRSFGQNRFIQELGKLYDEFYSCDQAPQSLAELDAALLSCGKGLLEVERTLHNWMTQPLRDRPLSDSISFVSGMIPIEAHTCLEYYLPDLSFEEDEINEQHYSGANNASFKRNAFRNHKWAALNSNEFGEECAGGNMDGNSISGGGTGACDNSGAVNNNNGRRHVGSGNGIGANHTHSASTGTINSREDYDYVSSFTGMAGDPGPSFFVTVELPPHDNSCPSSSRQQQHQWQNLCSATSLTVPYISDCYDEFKSPTEYIHAWNLLAQSAAQVITPNYPVVLSMCCRDFAQFALVTMKFHNSPSDALLLQQQESSQHQQQSSQHHHQQASMTGRRNSIARLNNNPPQKNQQQPLLFSSGNVVVRPLCNRLWWSNAEDRLALHDFTYGIAAWIKLTEFGK